MVVMIFLASFAISSRKRLMTLRLRSLMSGLEKTRFFFWVFLGFFAQKRRF
jgi:hypothetical protein